MVKGEQKKEAYFTDKPVVNYRKLEALNQSMIALFDSNPVAFFEQFKLGRPKKVKQNLAMDIGNLVDFFILECRANMEEFENRFDEQFALLEGTKGSAQVFDLADTLFDITEKSLNEKGETTSSFMTRFEAALAQVQARDKYKGKTVEKALEDFEKNGKEYYEKRLNNIGKFVVDASIVEKAKVVAHSLLKDEFTADAFEDGPSDNSVEKLMKFPIEWIYITISGKKIVCKSEVDLLEVDHDYEIIYIRDVKTTFDNESFEYSYIKNNYYLQAAFYYLAVKYWAEQNGLGSYQIRPMEFLVGDTSANNRRPIRYQLSKADIDKGLTGFYMRGTYYRGIYSLMEEISWCEDNDIWNCSKQVFDNKGVMQLNINYDGN